ncbi:glycosyltransferase family 2 protein [Glycomyces sp. NPDC048151]|uniref:glycosyltransferase family 2 protein n=1 Tax=Glycomyces sp. NPDC048151 TaxID=3364002 RepID=UPI003716C5B4
MTIKVSVIVPVYNTGANLQDNVDALLRQSLAPDEFEALFVDDGSTDGTGEMLDRLAAEHSHFHVIHQANSGWPGKPRNTGIERARGEYVMFVDDDDYLGDEALERMHRYGTDNGADIVVGKMAGRGRAVPKELFRRSRPKCTVHNAPLMDSLTCHKMIRREFLTETGIRFPVGKHRLEDHLFVSEAYLRARSVAVLADYTCYYHVRRDDGVNISQQRVDPDDYFAKLGKSIDVVEKYTEPGPARDRVLRRWLRVEMVEPLRGRRFLDQPADYRAQMFAAVRRTAARLGPGVAAGLQPVQRIVAGLTLADRLADLEALAAWEPKLRPAASLEGLAWHNGALWLDFQAWYEAHGKPLVFRGGPSGYRPDLPLSPGARSALDDLGLVGAGFDTAKVDLVVRERSTGADFFQNVEIQREAVTDGTATRLVLRCNAPVDPETAAGGKPLGRGVWDLLVRLSFSGWTKEVRLGSLRATAVEGRRAAGVVAGRLAVPYWTRPYGNLSLDIAAATSQPARYFARLRPEAARIEGGALRIGLPSYVSGSGEAVVAFTHDTDGRRVESPALVEPVKGVGELQVKLAADGLGPGRWKVAVGFTGGPEIPLPLALEQRSGREPAVVHLKPDLGRDETAEPRRPSLARRAVRKAKRMLKQR